LEKCYVSIPKNIRARACHKLLQTELKAQQQVTQIQLQILYP